MIDLFVLFKCRIFLMMYDSHLSMSLYDAIN